MWGFSGGSDGKESACSEGDPGLIPGSGRSPGKGMATHVSILAWRIPWREEPGGQKPGRLQSLGSQIVRHNWAIFTLFSLDMVPHDLLGFLPNLLLQLCDTTVLEFVLHCAKLIQSCPTLCDSLDCSPPGSSIYGILQVRILEWVTIPYSRGSS